MTLEVPFSYQELQFYDPFSANRITENQLYTRMYSMTEIPSALSTRCFISIFM
jgi:hypothetical protein